MNTYTYIHKYTYIYNSRADRGKSPGDKECSTETASKTTSIFAMSSFCFWSRPQIVGIMFRSVAHLCVAWCCSVLRGVAVCYSVSQLVTALDRRHHVAGRCTPVCCMVLQCIAKCCSVSHGVAVYCEVLQSVAWYCSVLRSVAVCYSVSQLVTEIDRRHHKAERCITVCCSGLQWFAV